MSSKSRSEYFRVLVERYRNAPSKKQQGIILDEAYLNTPIHRKSVIRAIGQALENGVKIPKTGRPRRFSEACSFLLKRLYRESDYQGPGKLHSMIPILIDQYKLEFSDEVLKEIKTISTASIDRYLKKYRNMQSKVNRCHTRPGSKLFRRIIPIKDLSNVVTKAGFMEGDTFGLMNKIYKVKNILTNYYIPQYRLLSKIRIGAKIKKKHDKPKTPYQRLLDSNISEERKQKLRDHYSKLSYPDLKKQREELLASFFNLHEKQKLNKRATSSSKEIAPSFGNTYL